jgi:uncharacterized protein
MKPYIAFLFACIAPMASAARPQSPAVQQTPPAPQSQSSAPPDKSDTSTSSTQAVDPAKRAAIQKLFEIQGTRDAMKTVLAGMSDNVRPMLESSLPAGEYRARLIDLFFQKFQGKLTVDKLLELSVPVYDKYFSLEEIDALTKFYQTPVGKKIMSVLPEVVLETQSAAMKLGEELGRQSMIEVLDEHPDLKKSLQDASAAQRNQ